VFTYRFDKQETESLARGSAVLGSLAAWGIAEEARTRGSAAPAFAGCAFCRNRCVGWCAYCTRWYEARQEGHGTLTPFTTPSIPRLHSPHQLHRMLQSPISTPSPSRSPAGLPGRFTTSVLSLTPARLAGEGGSGKASEGGHPERLGDARRFFLESDASRFGGVTSRSVRPVPPVARMRSARSASLQ
jgi:hypothetical protein